MALEEGAGLPAGQNRRPIRRRNGPGLGVGIRKGVEVDAERAAAIGFGQDMEGGAAKGGEGRRMVVIVPAGQIAEGFLDKRGDSDTGASPRIP